VTFTGMMQHLSKPKWPRSNLKEPVIESIKKKLFKNMKI
jgi:hypothetical protein